MKLWPINTPTGDSDTCLRMAILSNLVVQCVTRRVILAFLAVIASLCTVSVHAPAQESYYVIVFGSQTVPPHAEYSHTFATFVRVQKSCESAETPNVEGHTISWMPEALKIRLHPLLPETGVAFDLESTIQWALSTGQRISMWGPYQIQPALYCRAMKQISLLESGKVRYKAVDSGYPSFVTSNCIHGVAAAVDGHRIIVGSPSFGETASFAVLRNMRRWIIEPDCVHEWLVPVLGLNNYPLIHRGWENPRSNVFWTVIHAVTGNRDDLSQIRATAPF
jgi:hypothetical protein